MQVTNLLQLNGTGKRTNALFAGQVCVAHFSSIGASVAGASVVVVGASVTSSHLAQLAYLGSTQSLVLTSKLSPFGQDLKQIFDYKNY